MVLRVAQLVVVLLNRLQALGQIIPKTIAIVRLDERHCWRLKCQGIAVAELGCDHAYRFLFSFVYFYLNRKIFVIINNIFT